MKKIVLLVVVFVMLFSVASCAKVETDNSYNLNNPTQPNVRGGNWSFIDLNDISGSPSDNAELIADSIANWENRNPNREIVSLQIMHETYEISEYIDGISIYSKLK